MAIGQKPRKINHTDIEILFFRNCANLITLSIKYCTGHIIFVWHTINIQVPGMSSHPDQVEDEVVVQSGFLNDFIGMFLLEVWF